MMGYDFEVTYKKGSSNTMVDALFRKPQATLCALSTITSDLLQKIQHSWLGDPSLVHLLHKLKNALDKVSKYSWQEGQLRGKGRLVVGQDDELRTELLHYFIAIQ